MGLDMYAYSTSLAIPETDFNHPADAQLIAQWRKHPNLHGWMEQLYYAKGGAEEAFNCVNLRLTTEDLDALEIAVVNDLLPYTVGFFFGASEPDDRKRDVAFIADARRRLSYDQRIFYGSWW